MKTLFPEGGGRMKRRHGLAFRLSITLLPAVALVFTVILTYNHWREARSLRQATHEAASHALRSLAQEIRARMGRFEQETEMMAMLASAGIPDEGTLFLWIESALRANPDAVGGAIALLPVATVHTNGRAPYAWRDGGRIRRKDLVTEYMRPFFQQDWYQLPVLLRRTTWCEPYFDRGGGNTLMSTCSSPIFASGTGKEREVVGVATLDVPLEGLASWISRQSISEGRPILLSRHGTILANPTRRWREQENLFEIAEEKDLPVLRETALAMTRGEEGMVEAPDMDTGKPTLFFHAPVPDMGWSLALVIPTDVLSTPLWTRIRDLVLIFGGGLVCLFVTMLLLTRGIVRPMARLTWLAELVRFGRLGVARRTAEALEGEIAAGGLKIHEYAALAGATTGMVHALHRLLDRVRAEGAAVGVTAHNIMAGAAKLGAATDTQARDVRALASAAADISRRAAMLTDAMRKISRAAESHAALVGEGQERLRDVARDVGRLSEQTEALSERLAAIHEKTTRIADVVGVIDGISDRVNLLALNAGIEAGKAGESGSGFGVVAKEIRRLSDQTAAAAADIGQTVAEMTEAVRTGQEEMGRFLALMANRVTAVRDVDLRIEGRISGIRETVRSFRGVAEAMHRQAETAQGISGTVLQLSAAATAMQEQHRAFTAEAAQLEAAAESLREEVARFDLSEPASGGAVKSGTFPARGLGKGN